MTFKNDIIIKINTDFGDEAPKAIDILNDAVASVDELKQDRIIRCILFLAKGDLEDLINYIKAASADPRDVILWAEYEGLRLKEQPKRVRDFDKTFDESSEVNE